MAGMARNAGRRDPPRVARTPLPDPIGVLLWLIDAVVPKRHGRVVLHSFPDWEDTALALLSELRTRRCEVIVLVRDSSARAVQPEFMDGVRVLSMSSLSGQWCYFSAQIVLTTHALRRSHRIPRRQTYLNLWHGEGLKPTGPWDGERPFQASYYTTTSSIGRAMRVAQTGLPPRRILILGSPRNDRLMGADQSDMKRRAIGANTQRLLLWLPTFRETIRRIDGVHTLGPLGLAVDDLHVLDKWLAHQKIILLVKTHPSASPEQLPPAEHIRYINEAWLADRHLTLYQLLAATDVLITDVSSVWLDYLLIDRPIVLAFPDLEEYQARRAFVLDPFEDWVPGPTARTVDELIVALDDALSGEDSYAPVRAAFRRRLHRYRDAGSSRRIIDYLCIDRPADPHHNNRASL